MGGEIDQDLQEWVSEGPGAVGKGREIDQIYRNGSVRGQEL